MTMLSRREFSRVLLGAGTAGVAIDAARRAAKAHISAAHGAHQRCDLLIKGGTVIDPGQHLHAPLDVAVKDRKILEVCHDFPENLARQVISAKGRIVTPGLIDIHVHCFEGVAVGMNADRYCLGRGVTTVVDAGSAGYPAIAAFRKYVISTSATRVRALADIGAIGTLMVGGMKNLEWVSPDLAAKAVEENKPDVVGIKLRLAETYEEGAMDLECLKRAVEAAEVAHVPLMVHSLGPYSALPNILKLMRAGDVFTHCFNARKHGILDANGKILPEVLEARHRGVLFDTAQGNHNLSFDVTEKCLEQNFLPETISTDLTSQTVFGPVFDLPTQLSKFMALGLGLDKVIELATVNPARIFNYGAELGTLRPGSEADLAVFELRDGRFEFVDSDEQKREGRQALVNTLAIRSGQVFVNRT